jgi:hypothetical protein
VPTVSASSIIAETDNFKEGEFAHFWCKAAKKASMLTVDSRDRCDYFFFISPTSVFLISTDCLCIINNHRDR